MKRILIIGASILQLPAIKKAKEMGFYVGVADYNSMAVGIKYSDEFFHVSTIDIEGIVTAAKSFRPDGIMTLATDMPMRAIAAACQACGLLGISLDTAIKATDKGEMIKAFERYGVDCPWYYIVKNEEELKMAIDNLSFPCVVKPTDNAGSRGVVLCHDRKELEKAYEYAYGESRGGSVIIEEYLQGPEFSVEVIVVNKEPHVIQITDKLTTGAPHFVEMGHSQPSKQPEENKIKIRDLACRAVKAVGIDFGPVHVEMILTEQGPKMVELGARMGGDCIATHLVPLSVGVDMVRATIEMACGMEPDIQPKCQKGSAIRYFDTPAGTLKSITGIERAKKVHGVQEIFFVKGIGEKVGAIGSSVDRIGFVIAQEETPELSVKACENAIRKISVVVE